MLGVLSAAFLSLVAFIMQIGLTYFLSGYDVPVVFTSRWLAVFLWQYNPLRPISTH